MTLGEIIADVLHVLHPVGGEQITAESIGTYLEDDQYADEILRVPGAVNRALADMEMRRILPWTQVEGEASEGCEPVDVVEVQRASLEARDEPIGLPDRFERMIVHFVVAELELHDEPGISAVYRGMYEKECELARVWENGPERQTSVLTVFGL